jgi:hypothetical protein
MASTSTKSSEATPTVFTPEAMRRYAADCDQLPAVPMETLRTSPSFRDRLEYATLLAPPCGCRIEGSGVLPDPVRIVFCAGHAAGPDMAEALAPFAQQPVGGACCDGLTAPENCARCGPILRARAALAKVEGRS